MSGLVNGLQNRLQQFESARHLLKAGNPKWGFRFSFFPHIHTLQFVCGHMESSKNYHFSIDLYQKYDKKTVFW